VRGNKRSGSLLRLPERGYLGRTDRGLPVDGGARRVEVLGYAAVGLGVTVVAADQRDHPTVVATNPYDNTTLVEVVDDSCAAFEAAAHPTGESSVDELIIAVALRPESSYQLVGRLIRGVADDRTTGVGFEGGDIDAAAGQILTAGVADRPIGQVRPRLPEGGENPCSGGGVWLESGGAMGSTRTLATLDGQHLQLATGDIQAAPLLSLAYHGDGHLGIGSDPATVRAVLDSIRYDPKAPDPPAGGGCPGWVRAAMPRPIRATTTRTFDGLNQLMDLYPAPEGAEPVVSAAAAWEVALHGHPARGVSYQVLLGQEALRWRAVKVRGRFTSVPAAPLTPVWAVYGVGITTRYGDCGGHVVTIIDAATGKVVTVAGGQ
jgi:hypothetical protein